MNALAQTKVEYVAHSYTASYEEKALGEDCHAIEQIEAVLKQADVMLDRLRANASSSETREYAHTLYLGLHDAKHDADWHVLVSRARDAEVTANVKPMLVEVSA